MRRTRSSSAAGVTRSTPSPAPPPPPRPTPRPPARKAPMATEELNGSAAAATTQKTLCIALGRYDGADHGDDPTTGVKSKGGSLTATDWVSSPQPNSTTTESSASAANPLRGVIQGVQSSHSEQLHSVPPTRAGRKRREDESATTGVLGSMDPPPRKRPSLALPQPSPSAFKIGAAPVVQAAFSGNTVTPRPNSHPSHCASPFMAATPSRPNLSSGPPPSTASRAHGTPPPTPATPLGPPNGFGTPRDLTSSTPNTLVGASNFPWTIPVSEYFVGTTSFEENGRLIVPGEVERQLTSRRLPSTLLRTADQLHRHGRALHYAAHGKLPGGTAARRIVADADAVLQAFVDAWADYLDAAAADGHRISRDVMVFEELLDMQASVPLLTVNATACGAAADEAMMRRLAAPHTHPPAEGAAGATAADAKLKVPPYRILDKVGSGTFSMVYKAVDCLHLEHKNDWCPTHSFVEVPPCSRIIKCGVVAIKRIYPTSSLKRVQREIEMLKKLEGLPNLSVLVTAFRYKEQVLAVLPYYQHMDIKKFMQHICIQDIQIYIRCLCNALDGVHSHKIIHRDVKQSNFLYNPEWRTGILVDFGLAEYQSEPQEPKTIEDPTEFALYQEISDRQEYIVNDPRKATRASRAGTRGYRSPEVLLRVTHQTTALDMWSVGVVLLSFLACSYPVFHSGTDTEALVEIIKIFGIDELRDVGRKMGCIVKADRTIAKDPTPLPRMIARMRGLPDDALLPVPQSPPSPTAARPPCPRSRTPTPDAVRFLERCLTLDPTRRITAREALADPFLAEVKGLEGTRDPRGWKVVE
ncbi:kinase-like domain-containing protein [Zopfochytrium polystomum]|nr:kinase-like domain-containing protein [Zopfochytrium polystomum]